MVTGFVYEFVTSGEKDRDNRFESKRQKIIITIHRF
jgi:hypothetical protein